VPRHCKIPTDASAMVLNASFPPCDYRTCGSGWASGGIRAADVVTTRFCERSLWRRTSLDAIDPATRMRRTQALRFLQTTLQIDVRRALDSSTEHRRCSRRSREHQRPVSSAGAGRTASHLLENAVSSNSSLQRRTPIALMRCTHTA